MKPGSKSTSADLKFRVRAARKELEKIKKNPGKYGYKIPGLKRRLVRLEKEVLK